MHSKTNSVIHVSILFSNSFPFRLLYNIEQSSLCYTIGPCWLSILFSFFKSLFDVDHFLSLYWIRYNIASVLCFGFLASEACGILASWPGQGSNLHPLHWQCSLNHWITRDVLVIYFKYSSVYTSIPNSLTAPPPPLPGNHKFTPLSLWVYFVNKFFCIIFFLISHISDVMWCLSLSDSLHSVWQSLGLSMLL